MSGAGFSCSNLDARDVDFYNYVIFSEVLDLSWVSICFVLDSLFVSYEWDLLSCVVVMSLGGII